MKSLKIQFLYEKLMKNNQKILYIDGYFKLPDNFDGNKVNAIEELVHYLKHNSSTKNETNKLVIDQEFSKDTLWEIFLQMIESSDKLFCGEMEISQYNENNDKMEIINK